MKKIKNILVMVAVLASVIACDRDFESDNIAVGTIRFPAIQLTGDEVVVVNAGGTYTDAGAVALLGTDDITARMETTTDLDLTKPGVYTVNYTVSDVNELGQESTVTQQRYIAVAPTNPNTTVDLSGTYNRAVGTATGVATWTKVAPGLYINDNVGGVPPPSTAIIPVFVFHYADGTLSIPEQAVPNGYGVLDANITLTPTGYTLAIPDTPGFGAQNRIFVKQ